MSANELNYKILWLLTYNFKVNNHLHLTTASFSKDLNFNQWDINLLLYYIEQNFNVTLKKGLENEVDNVHQLVSLTLNEMHNKKLQQKNLFAIAS